MKRFALISLFTFIFIMLFGLNLSMRMDKDGKMSNCPVMTHSSSICPMGPFEYLAKWQQMFQATAQTNMLFLFITLFSFNALFSFFRIHLTLAPPKRLSFAFYKRDHPDINLFNYLQEAFSSGILQPKLYN